VRVVLAFLVISASVACVACTETPSSFPPCILDSPCPDAAVLDEGGDDGSDASTVDASIDASAE
jgi:hypothetical protein